MTRRLATGRPELVNRRVGSSARFPAMVMVLMSLPRLCRKCARWHSSTYQIGFLCTRCTCCGCTFRDFRALIDPSCLMCSVRRGCETGWVEDQDPQDLSEVVARLRQFAAERDWDQFHSPRNLLLAL